MGLPSQTVLPAPFPIWATVRKRIVLHCLEMFLHLPRSLFNAAFHSYVNPSMYLGSALIAPLADIVALPAYSQSLRSLCSLLTFNVFLFFRTRARRTPLC